MSDVPQRLNPCGFTSALSQVVELAATDATADLYLDLLETWAVEREYTLYSNAVRELSYGECRAKAIIMAREARSLEDLDALFFTLSNTNVDTQGVSSSELRDVLA